VEKEKTDDHVMQKALHSQSGTALKIGKLILSRITIKELLESCLRSLQFTNIFQLNSTYHVVRQIPEITPKEVLWGRRLTFRHIREVLIRLGVSIDRCCAIPFRGLQSVKNGKLWLRPA
jgi:hypothetical protein